MEANFDGIVGPTHNYAGLSWGNVASKTNQGAASRPKEAALQSLAKARRLAELGLVQGVLPPQERPDLRTLRRLGYGGSDAQALEAAWRDDRVLLAACCSASSMWAANAATVAPSADTADGRLHLTPANLRSTFHRSLEPEGTARALRTIFAGEPFVHHDPLPGSAQMGDEGAANHTRLHAGGDGPGVHLSVYGRRAFGAGPEPERFPARQTYEASRAVARLHGLDPARTVFAQQNPAVVDAGVFHNDVIAVGHGRVLLFHEEAFLDTEATLDELERALDGALLPIRVRSRDVSVSDAVASYLFNSQLVTAADGSMVLVAPSECEQNDKTRRLVDAIVADGDNPIGRVLYLDVRQSMRNGGGPACLRLRVELDEPELAATHQACVLDQGLYERLTAWVRRRYRDELSPRDLADPHLLEESRAALDELTTILALGDDFYPFQR